jgi:hypothetical protein
MKKNKDIAFKRVNKAKKGFQRGYWVYWVKIVMNGKVY